MKALREYAEEELLRALKRLEEVRKRVQVAHVLWKIAEAVDSLTPYWRSKMDAPCFTIICPACLDGNPIERVMQSHCKSLFERLAKAKVTDATCRCSLCEKSFRIVGLDYPAALQPIDSVGQPAIGPS